TRHLWHAARGSAREVLRLQAQLCSLPERGHVVLRLPAQLAQPDAALARVGALAAWLATHRPEARLTVLDGGDGSLGQQGKGRWLRATVLSVDTDRGRIETDAGRIEADVVNFVPPQQAGLIARAAGLTDASGWCPCDAGGASRRREGAAIIGDARRDALRTVEGALRSVRDAL
ncbi:sulfide dehydrogenase, partial [Salipiger sp. HF18]|nr:sulfide dehydrogenase [Salipiger sp. HF18]